MIWNYRIIYHDTKDPPYYGLHEVYYNEDGSVATHTSEPFVVGDDPWEIIADLRIMISDIENRDPLVGSSLKTNIQDW